MVAVIVLLFLWSVTSSWAQAPSIRPAFGTRAAVSALSVTDGTKCEIEVSGGGTCWTIIPDAVTNPKLADMPPGTLKGNNTGGTANPLDLTAGQVKAMLGLTFGDIGGTALASQLPQALADGTTRGVVTFVATDFNCTAGLCSFDYANAQPASSTTKGLLTSADWIAFDAKQAALGFTAENVANKSTDATLALARNTHYPTEGAVKTYVDSGQKAMTNTALTPRACTGANAATITINANNLTGCDFVQVAELSQTTNFDLTAGTYVNGQFLSILIFTTTQRALTWTTGAGKFAAEGIALPTFSRAAGYVLYGFRYNALSNRWALASTNQETTYGAVGHVLTGNGPGVASSFQAPTGGPGGGTGTIHLPMTAVHFPTADPAILDGSGTNARLLFDNVTKKCAYWGPFRMNADYVSTPVFKFQYAMTSVLSGGVSIDVDVMTVPAGDAASVHTESYGTVNNCDDAAVPATTAGRIDEISCPLTNNDGLAAGRFTKIRLCRAVADAIDTANGILEGIAASLEYTK